MTKGEKSMKKTGFALLFAFGLASVMNGYAADISAKDVNITVRGTKSADENVRLNVVNADGDLVWIDSVQADAEGKYELNFKVPFENTAKEYTVTVNGTETEKITINGAEDIINNLPSLSENDFDSYVNTYAERFELSLEDYSSLTDKATVYKVFKTFSMANETEFKESFEKTLGICKINEAARGDVFDILEKYEKIAPNYKADTKNLTTSQKEKFATELVSSDYYSMTEFESGYAAALKAAKNPDGSTGGSSSSGGSIGGGSYSGGSGGGSVSGGKGGFVVPPASTVTPSTPVTPGENNEPFSDLAEADWAKASILKLYEKGIVNGKENGKFAPNDTVTREEFAAMMVRAFDLKSQTSANFADVAADAWYAEVINAAVENGIVNGISETEFGVSQELTRQDCAAMCERLLTLLGVETEADTEIFADDAEIADYAKTAVYKLKKLGIISGVGENMFAPNEPCTRAMTAKIIDMLGEYGK